MIVLVQNEDWVEQELPVFAGFAVGVGFGIGFGVGFGHEHML